ncbi:BON domain-containing protein [Aquisphaera insulae]|uniref:BON domain-containing protein n=1 Tax=Aquisphaera insulae TaxID=2712864 RepID=UPI0013EB13E6|nr:BON domain-containing protein [Aquisphaera insulae]
MMVGLKRISTVVGLFATTATLAFGQGTSTNPNQTTADSVAGALRSSRTLSGSRIEIDAQDGVVSLTGTLASPALKAEAVARAQRVAGVRGVVDQIRVADQTVRTVQYQPQQVAMGHLHGGGTVINGGTTGGIVSGPAAGGFASGPAAGGFVNDGGPLPEGPAGGGSAGGGAAPGAPNYAWPSYAPYPNFSAVGYPTAYPWQAWPNIGPFYPYPEVPLDWRAVTLRWDDGIWWLDFKKHYTRPFFTPYPFGLFAY